MENNKDDRYDKYGFPKNSIISQMRALDDALNELGDSLYKAFKIDRVDEFIERLISKYSKVRR